MEERDKGLLPHMHQPLEIKDRDSMRPNELASYKPRWNSQLAKMAILPAGMHEAAGNLLWVDPFPPAGRGAAAIAGEPLYWPHIAEVARICFGEQANQRGHLPAASQGAVARLMFPAFLYALAQR